MPIAVSQDQVALQESLHRWAARAEPRATVRAQEPPSRRTGQDRQPGGPGPHWAELAELGLFGIALPDDLGGGGAGAADLVAALEQVAWDGVPGPVLPTLLAALVLVPFRTQPAVAELLAGVSSGKASVGMPLPPETVSVAAGTALTALPDRSGALRVSGQVRAVLGAGASPVLLLPAVATQGPPGGRPDGEGTAGLGQPGLGQPGLGQVGLEQPGLGQVGLGQAGLGWVLVEAEDPAVSVHPRSPVDFSGTLGDVRVRDLRVPSGTWISAPGPGTAAVRDVAAMLAAAEAAGVAGWCLHTAVEHARTREQFGRPIGSFQAVKHLCAGMLCRVEQACAAAWDAAQAFDRAPAELPLAAAVAAAVAVQAAVENAKDCIQVLGGIGFTWEHDAHLYLRRAIALRQLLGGTAAWHQRAARLALAGTRRTRGAVGAADAAAPGRAADEVDSQLPAGTEPGLAGGGTGGVDEATRAAVFERAAAIGRLPAAEQRAALAEAGLLDPAWPPPYGLGADPAMELVVDEALHRAGVPRPDLAVAAWAVPTVLRFGTTAQRDRFVGPSLRGELVWCQLFSEPGAGSDLASVRTRAERVDGGWRLSGQKVWTSLAAEADWGICLARTDPDVPRHRGLTYFLVPMRSPGITVRPLREITGRAVFNEVFLDGVLVPDDCVVGEPGQGWRVARGTLDSERVSLGRGSALGEAVERLVADVASKGLAGEPGVPERLGQVIAEGLTLSAMDLRGTVQRMAGGPAGAGSAVRKLVGVAHRQAVAETALELAGIEGAAADGEAAEAVHGFLLSRCLSIAGGTTQILLTVVGERELGLPREEVR